jgi:hypothetical protein
MQIQNCVSIVQVFAGVVDGRVVPKMGSCDFGGCGVKDSLSKFNKAWGLRREGICQNPNRSARIAENNMAFRGSLLGVLGLGVLCGRVRHPPSLRFSQLRCKKTPPLRSNEWNGCSPGVISLLNGGNSVSFLSALRTKRFAIGCVAMVIIFSSSAYAQQHAINQQPVATPPDTSFTQQLRNTVGFLQVNFRDGGELKSIAGTCFFVLMDDARLPENHGFLYLVTNRHMAEPGIEKGVKFPVERTMLRLNLTTPQGEIGSMTGLLQTGGGTHWFFSSDESVDLAIIPISLDTKIFDFQAIPFSALATADQIRTQAIDAGDPVLFAGYFYQFFGQNRLAPIVRHGTLAMMPKEKLSTTLQKPGQLYLADVHAFHGNSGSPLFVDVGGIRRGRISSDSYLLIGIISGYYPEGESFSVPAATVLTGEVHDNSGIATVVPVEELSMLLNSPEVKARRDAEVAQATAKSSAQPK